MDAAGASRTNGERWSAEKRQNSKSDTQRPVQTFETLGKRET
jgi:hypothetical protein